MTDFPASPIVENGDTQRLVSADVDAAFAAARASLQVSDTLSARSCRRCGDPLEAGSDRCARCQSFAPGNQAARTHGLRASQPPADLRMTADELMAGIIADRGGDANLTTLERSYIRKLADVEIVVRLLTSNIAQRGLFTASGKVRDVYDKLLSGLDRFDRLAQRIGIDRRPKDIGAASLSDYVAASRRGEDRNPE